MSQIPRRTMTLRSIQRMKSWTVVHGLRSGQLSTILRCPILPKTAA